MLFRARIETCTSPEPEISFTIGKLNKNLIMHRLDVAEFSGLIMRLFQSGRSGWYHSQIRSRCRPRRENPSGAELNQRQAWSCTLEDRTIDSHWSASKRWSVHFRLIFPSQSTSHSFLTQFDIWKGFFSKILAVNGPNDLAQRFGLCWWIVFLIIKKSHRFSRYWIQNLNQVQKYLWGFCKQFPLTKKYLDGILKYVHFLFVKLLRALLNMECTLLRINIWGQTNKAFLSLR